jgi:hypothetical protein
VPHPAHLKHHHARPSTPHTSWIHLPTHPNIYSMRACVHACMRACVHACVHACMRAFSCSHALMLSCSHAFMLSCFHAFILSFFHAFMPSCFTLLNELCVRACVRACVHACMRACVHACMHACLHLPESAPSAHVSVSLCPFRMLYLFQINVVRAFSEVEPWYFIRARPGMKHSFDYILCPSLTVLCRLLAA